MDLEQLKYTLCFVRQPKTDLFLTLLRNNEPNANMYNGVGGKIIYDKENAYQANIREVYEETGFTITTVRFAGVVTWGDDFDKVRNGMYVYMAELPVESYKDVWIGGQKTEEGTLHWCTREFLLQSDSVVDNIKHFLPDMLNCKHPVEHFCLYGWDLVGVTQKPLDQDLINKVSTSVYPLPHM